MPIDESDMLRWSCFEARALVDLYGDGRKVLPGAIDNGAVNGHDPVVVQFPEALQA